MPRLAAILIALAGFVLAVLPLPAGSAKEGYLHVYAEETVWAPSEHPRLMVRGQGATRLDLSVWKFDPAAYYRERGSLQSVTRVTPSDAALIRKFTEYPRPKKPGGDFTLSVPVPAEGIGGYLVKVSDNQGRGGLAWIVVSDLGLVTKQAQGKLLVYAHRFGGDAPCPEARVSVFCEGEEIGSGVTGPDGLWVLERPDIPRGVSVVGTAAGAGFAHADSSYYWEDSRYKAYIYTDRPIYRPGQRVSFKGVLREEAGGDYKVLSAEPVRVEVRDPGDACVYRVDAVTGEFGSFSGEFWLGDEPALGSYRVLATIRGSTHYGWFRVAEYRKPEYQVEVQTGRATYVAGDEMAVSVKATYYFGAPVPGAKVRYSVFSQPHQYWYYSNEDLGYYPVEDESFGYYGELVESGEGVTDRVGCFSFVVRTKAAQVTRKFFVEAVVTDESRREVTGRVSAIVARGLFEVIVQPEAYVLAPGERAKVGVKTQDLEGKPVSTTLTWQAMRVTWKDRTSTRWKEASGTATTQTDGEAAFEFVPREEGSYVVEVSGTDGRGNRITSEGHVWVTSQGSRWASYGGTEIEVVADKDVYEVGDTARILVNTTFDDVWALVTMEGRDLGSYEVVHITGHTRLFEVPIVRDHLPNAFFAVTFVRGKRLYSQHETIYVSAKDNFLSVSVIPNKETYGPGERATCVVKTTDAAGRPVRAEVSLGVVDASIYAVQPEIAPDIRKAFYGSIWNRVTTNYSFPQWYYGGADKEGGTSDVRREFPDTALWVPSIVTDRNGTAKVELDLPDSLTTWRATARAHTLKTQVGTATRDIVVTKDLIVRLATPRHFTLGDTTAVSTIVHNYTGRRVEAKVGLKGEGITLEEPGERMVAIEPMGQALLDWKVTCGAVGDARLVATAQAGRARDALEVSVPVLPFGVRHEQYEAGEIDGDAGNAGARSSLKVNVPREALPGTVRMNVRLAPSIAATALGALEYLASFPYGCVEQTMNSFLPNIVVARTLRDLGIDMPEVEKDLPKMVSAGLARLYRYQHYDGGWGWWEYDDTDPRMTAYVVFGLDLARAAGFDVDEQVLARGRKALRELAGKPRDVDDLVYKLYVMSKVGEKTLPRLDEMVARRRELSDYSLALLALTLNEVERRAEAGRVLGDLMASARGDESATYWDASAGERYWADNSVETTAYALLAALAVAPAHERIPGMVRWLADARRGGAWFSTKDTAIAIFALADYIKLRGEASPGCTATVSLNGKRVGKADFVGKSVLTREAEIAIDPADLVSGENEVTVTRTGRGRLYFAVSCEYYTPADTVAPEGQGLAVTRGYYRRTLDSRAKQGQAAGATRVKPDPGGPAYTYEPVTGPLKPGEEVFVRIVVKTDRPYTYVVIEDPLPSGFEVVEEPFDAYSWEFWYGRKEVRDEKVAFFSGYLKEGENEIVYPIRAERPGRYRIMPTRAWGMYAPDVFGQSGSSELACEEPVLASFSTTIRDAERSRNHNIALAASAIDGAVVRPGEVFSFDGVVGPRLSSSGYKEARVISGGKSAPGIAGGICQVSTTLYNVALLAGLDIVERHPHSRPVGYVPPGLDATVSENQYDLRLRNPLDVPLTLEARVDGNRLVMGVRAPIARYPRVTVSTELREVERPRLMGGASPEEPASGGGDGIRVAVWRSFQMQDETRRELVSEDYYKPVHAVASAER